MIELIILLIALGFVMKNAIKLCLYVIKHKKENINEHQIKHADVHMAGVILMLISGAFLFIGFSMILYELSIGITYDPKLDQVNNTLLTVYMISNIWYLHHLQDEEQGWCKY